MTKERHLALSAKGGRSAQRQGKAHRWTAEEAQVAGRKGGKRTAKDPKHMSKVGR